MAKKNATAKKAPEKKAKVETSTARFPYTTKPNSLRRLLGDIPKKPKPPKFDQALLKSWGFSDTNDMTMLRVLKAIGLVNASNEPTELYAQFMLLNGGASAIAEPIRRVYEPLFHASHNPDKESNDVLQNLFNIHSGGGERSLEQQIQTFKALCENTTFSISAQGAVSPATATSSGSVTVTPAANSNLPSAVHINVHIHLPENKTRRDYETIIEDIGRYIFGRTGASGRDE